MAGILTSNISMHRWGNPAGTPLLFLHANSYSAELYAPLFQPMGSDFDIWAPDLPGHGKSRWHGRISAWEEVADTYIAYFDLHPPKKPFIGIGHSIGGVIIMLMSLKRPEWFQKIVLLDPVLLPKGVLFTIRILKLLSLTHLIPLARAANRRKSRFKDRPEALAHYGAKKVFSRWQPEFLEAYVDTCFYKISSGELSLACHPQLESSIYQSIPLSVWKLVGKLSHPAFFIIGRYSDTVNHRGVKRLRRRCGNDVVKRIDGGHLFPFEKPEETRALIKEFLA